MGADHLGGTIRVLNDSFTALDGMRYKPYGEDRDTGTSLNTDRKFTGQTEDEAAGLYWYASRAYDPEIGRFVSPDSMVPAPGNPQSLNRYSYVYNNPLKYTDPSGHTAGYNVKDDKDWYLEYFDRHKREPSASDEDFRQASMEAALQGRDFSVEYWAGEIERAASNVADSVSSASSNVADSASRAPSNKRSQTYHYPQKALNRNMVSLDENYNPTIDPYSQGVSYYIVNVNGVTVVNHAEGAYGDLLRLTGRERNTIALSPNLIISTYNVSDYPKIMQHEGGHQVQAKLMGVPYYLASYGGGYIALDGVARAAALVPGVEYDPNFAHTYHPMEITANLIAGLPPFWRPTR